MTRAVPALSGIVLSALLALGAVAGPPVLVAALLLVVVAVASGWPALLSLPTQRGSTTIVALCGAVAVSVVGLTQGGPLLRWLPGVLALSVITAFWHQLLRRDMRPRLVESVTGVVSGVVAVELSAGWIGALHSPGGAPLVLMGTTAVAVACLATGLPWPQKVTGPVAVVAGAAFAALAGALLPDLHAVPSAAVGAVAALLVVSIDRILGQLPTTASRQAGISMGAAEVAATGVVVYLVSRVVIG
ncbi:MAG: hypothetical protein ACLGIA_12150 [Actinomycetes bacterium]